MEEIKIQVPDGKTAKWIDGVLTLVDKEVKDNRPVTERIKTFTDACNALGDEHPLVTQYRLTAAAYKGDPMTEDFIAYLKLRIIAAALNEGWEPKFTTDEWRWYPWFTFYTQEEIAKMTPKQKGRVVGRAVYSSSASGGVAYTFAVYASSYSVANSGSRLAFKTEALAEYAGKQFLEIWADFVFKPRTGEEVEGKVRSEGIIKFPKNE